MVTSKVIIFELKLLFDIQASKRLSKNIEFSYLQPLLVENFMYIETACREPP